MGRDETLTAQYTLKSTFWNGAEVQFAVRIEL